MTWMLDYGWVMCFTSYQLNWNPWIWIPFPVDLDCTLLCAQVDRTRYRSIASGNNCIVQLCKCVSLNLQWALWIHPMYLYLVALPLLDSLATMKVLLKHTEVCNKSNHIISGTVSTITGIHSKIVSSTTYSNMQLYQKERNLCIRCWWTWSWLVWGKIRWPRWSFWLRCIREHEIADITKKTRIYTILSEIFTLCL